MAGATPSTAINNGTGYTATLNYWIDKDENAAEGPFAAGKVYRAIVALTAAEGYIFAGVIQGFKPDDAESIELTGGSDGSRFLDITYPVTAPSGGDTGNGDDFTPGGGSGW